MKICFATTVVLTTTTAALAGDPLSSLQTTSVGWPSGTSSMAAFALDTDSGEAENDRAWTLISGVGANKVRKPWFEDADVRIDLRPGVQAFVGVSTDLSKRWSADLTLGAAWNSISSLNSCGYGGSTRSPLSGVTGGCDCCSTTTTGSTTVCDIDRVCSYGGSGTMYQVPLDFNLSYQIFKRSNFEINLRGGAGVQYTHLKFNGVTVINETTNTVTATSLRSKGNGLSFHFQFGVDASWEIAENMRLGGYFNFGQALSAQIGKVYWHDPSNPTAGELGSDPQRIGPIQNFGLGVRFTIEF